jgi:hypothetical protein
MLKPVQLLGALLAVGCFETAATAAPVVWQLEGQVGGVYSLSGPQVPIDVPALTALGVVPGAPLTATIVVEPTTPDSDASPDFANFIGGVLSMSFSAGSYSVSVGGGGDYSQLVVNVADQGMLVNLYGPGASSIFNPLFALEVQADVPGTFIDAMPIDPPPLASLHPFDPNPNTLFGFGTSIGTLADVQIRGSLTRWARVPEPGLAWLALLALGGVSLRSRSRS